MIKGLRALDRVLRGEATELPALQQGGLSVPAFPLLSVLVVLGMVAGACTGVYAVITRYHQDPATAHMGWEQMLASTIKVPLLFCLTLLITFPSLYVFNALVGSKLKMAAMLRLLIAALAVMMAVLASLGPIVAFFAVSTTSYPFMKLLNVIAYAIAGILGLSFLLQTLHRLSAVGEDVAPPRTPGEDAGAGAGDLPPEPPQYVPQPEDATGVPPYPPQQRFGALQRFHTRVPDPRVKRIFQIWVVVFGLVGAQMSWVLRPFIGNPDQKFSMFRERESNFFNGITDSIKKMMGS